MTKPPLNRGWSLRIIRTAAGYTLAKRFERTHEQPTHEAALPEIYPTEKAAETAARAMYDTANLSATGAMSLESGEEDNDDGDENENIQSQKPGQVQDGHKGKKGNKPKKRTIRQRGSARQLFR